MYSVIYCDHVDGAGEKMGQILFVVEANNFHFAVMETLADVEGGYGI